MNQSKALSLSQYFIGGLFVLFTSLCSVTIIGFLLALGDFAYPLWYDLLAIGGHIEQFSPANHFKPYLHLADKAEHIRLFEQINSAVLNGGQGLANIKVHNPDEKLLGHLLRSPEIIHLQDVAHLFAKLQAGAIASVIIWTALLIGLWRKNYRIPTMKQQLITLLSGVVVCLLLLLVFGAESIFNQMHLWVFPVGHPWYFYYEDSLMSTLMKAPDLFLAIAGLWAVLAGVLTIGLSYLINWLFVGRRPTSSELV